MRAERGGIFSRLRRSRDADALDMRPPDGAPAIAVTGPGGEITQWNPRAEALFGRPRAQAVGRNFSEIVRDDDPVGAKLAEAVLAGAPFEGEVVLPGTSGSRTALVSVSPADEPGGAVVVAVDVTGHVQGERRLVAQYAASRVLAEATTLAEVAPRILEAMGESLGWDVGAIWEVHAPDGVIRAVHVWQAPGLGADEFEKATLEAAFPPGVGLPGRVWKSGRPIWIPDVVRDRNFPRAPVAKREDIHGGFCFPIVLHGHVLGAIEFFSREVRDPDGALLDAVGAVGSQIGQFMERVATEQALQESEERLRELLARERSVRTETEEVRRRLEFLAEAAAALSASLSYEKTLAKVAKLAVPRLADWCSVDMVDGAGSIRHLAVVHIDRKKVRMAEELWDRYPLRPDATYGASKVLRTGEPELYPEISDSILQELGIDDEHHRILEDLGFRSLMVVPLTARGRTLGIITFVSGESGRRYDSDDLSLAQALASRAAMAIDNARLYQERSHIARTLQRSLLPPELPTIPGVEVAAGYEPVGEGYQVGGDFYDLFERADGEWFVVVGDVCGKGPDAAALTGLARHTIRTAAVKERRPSRVLRMLNSAIRQDESDRFCTVACGRVAARPGKASISITCGGHPLPRVLRANGTVERAGKPGTLIGPFDDPELIDVTVHLGPGDALVLFTDGLMEDRHRESVRMPQEIDPLIQQCAFLDAEKIAERLEYLARRRQDGELRDDIALMVLRVTP